MKFHGEIKHKWIDTKDNEYNTYNLARRGGARMLQRRHWTVVQLCQGPEMQWGFALHFGFDILWLYIIYLNFGVLKQKPASWCDATHAECPPRYLQARRYRHWHRQADLRRGQLHRDLSACWQTMPIAIELSCKYSNTVCANKCIGNHPRTADRPL